MGPQPYVEAIMKQIVPHQPIRCAVPEPRTRTELWTLAAAALCCLALVRGHLAQETGTIDRPIGRHPRERKRKKSHPRADLKNGHPGLYVGTQYLLRILDEPS